MSSTEATEGEASVQDTEKEAFVSAACGGLEEDTFDAEREPFVASPPRPPASATGSNPAPAATTVPAKNKQAKNKQAKKHKKGEVVDPTGPNPAWNTRSKAVAPSNHTRSKSKL